MTKSVNFTKTSIDKLIPQTTGKRSYYKDTQVTGLSLAVQPSGVKSFYVIKKIAGKSVKIFLGKYPDLSIENARKQAKVTLGQIALGKNPQTEKQRKRDEQTFGEFFQEYMTRYSKPHKKTWQSDQRDIPRFCHMWFPKKLSDISKADIQYLHETIFAENGLYMANAVFKAIRAMYNKAIDWGWQGINPAKGIKKFREQSRDRFIQPVELPHMLRAINDDPNVTIRDYFMILLLTGVRKTNTMMMRWDQINWELAEWRIPDTKNGEPVVVPLTDEAILLLRNRQQLAGSPWVFPSAKNPDKHLSEVKRQWREIKERATTYMKAQNPLYAASLMDIRIHDIRRTFGSYQAMSGASLQVIGKSLGHKSTQATQIYARLNLDAVRASVVKATGVMLAFQ